MIVIFIRSFYIQTVEENTMIGHWSSCTLNYEHSILQKIIKDNTFMVDILIIIHIISGSTTTPQSKDNQL